MPDLALKKPALFGTEKKKNNIGAKTKKASEGKGKKEKKKKGKKEGKKKGKKKKKRKKKKEGKGGKIGIIPETSYNSGKFKLSFEIRKGKLKKLLHTITLYNIITYMLYNPKNKIVMPKINKFKIFITFLRYCLILG